MNEHDIWYIAGAVEGGGCVTCTLPCHLRFCIGQSEKSMAILDFIQQRFGGNIVEHKPHPKWAQFYELTVDSPAAMCVCAKLAPYLFIKRKQFEVASKWPATVLRPLILTCKTTGERLVYRTAAECERAHHLDKERVSKWLRSARTTEIDALKGFYVQYGEVDKLRIQAEREHVHDQLHTLKRIPHCSIPDTDKLNYPYAAGWIDTDGCMYVQGKGCVAVNLGQKYRAICDAFKHSFGGSVYEKKTAFHWVMYKGSRDFIRCIYPYLIGKKKQAGLLLSMQKGEEQKIAAELSLLNGGQKGQSLASRLERASNVSSEGVVASV